MNDIFGISMNGIMWVFGVSFAVILALVLITAVRNPVLFKLGTRYIWRRPGRTALIVAGLMLGTTIITAAFGTGDSISHTVRSAVVTQLGGADEVISSSANSSVEGTGESAQLEYFPETDFQTVKDAVAGQPAVDGVAPAIVENVAIQNPAQQQSEPRSVLFATTPDAATFSPIQRSSDGERLSIDSLGSGEIYLNDEGAKQLLAGVGSSIDVYTPAGVQSFVVKEVIRNQGVGTANDPSIVMPLAQAQSLLNKPGQIKHIIVSNKGGDIAGAARTEQVAESLKPTLDKLGLGLEKTKKDQLEAADGVAASFTSFFLIFGMFSIAAGILLIFLIFVMLSGERRSEMGMARAVGAERGHLVRMFVFEGMAYDLGAALIGAALGTAVAFGMLYLMAQAFEALELDFRFNISLRSLVVAYTVGVVLTFIVVTLSAWRVSLLNVVSAIRNLPEGGSIGKGKGSLLGVAVIVLGLLLVVSGLSSKQAAPFHLGVSLIIVGTVPLMLRFGVKERIAFTFPGIALVVWWLLPAEALSFIIPDLAMDFSIFVLSGLMVVTGATWTIMYNSDILLGAIMNTAGRIRWLTPSLKTSIAYPLKNRFRVGVTLAMFTLVVFTLVTGGTTVTAFTNAFDDVKTFGGGYDIHASAVRSNPIEDLQAGLKDAGLDSQFDSVASLSVAVVDAKQSDAGRDFETYALRGLDDNFLKDNAYAFSAIATGYGSARDVWTALQNDPSLAVVDSVVAPHRDKFGISPNPPDFQLSGFFVEDGSFNPIPVDLRDPKTGGSVHLTIIGVLNDVAPPYMIGISTSQAVLDRAFPEQAQPTTYLLKVKDGVDKSQARLALKSAFFANGMEAELLSKELADLVKSNRIFNYIMQGFMGLGLVVGVAALGVISARAVVERRHEIGVMRAIGFEERTVQFAFLLESSFVAIMGILAGTALALVVAYNVIHDASSQPSWQSISFAVPWLNLIIIFAVVYGAALLTAYLPARQASRIYPAQALRYQ